MTAARRKQLRIGCGHRLARSPLLNTYDCLVVVAQVFAEALSLKLGGRLS